MARVEQQTQQAVNEQLEAEARARAVEEKIQLEEQKMKAKSKSPAGLDKEKSTSAVGFKKPAEKKVAAKPPPQNAGKSLRDLAESGKRGRNNTGSSQSQRIKDVVDSAANNAKYKVVVLKEGNKSELEGPLKDLLGQRKEASSRKNDNY
jgi:hypothetical protein